MARQYAKFRTDMWRLDDDLRGLPREAQHLYFVLITSPDLSLAGVADWRPNRVAKLADGWTPKQVTAAAKILTDGRFILVDEDTEEVLVRTFIKHDELLRSHTTAIGVVTAWGSVYSQRLRLAVSDEVTKLAEGLSDRVAGVIAPILAYPAHGVADTPCDTPSDAPHRQTANSKQQTADVASAARFSEFYAAFPKKVAPAKAEAAWKSATKKADPDTIIAGAREYARQSEGTESRFIKHPTTWLNGACWLDETPPPTRPSGYRIEEDWSA